MRPSHKKIALSSTAVRPSGRFICHAVHESNESSVRNVRQLTDRCRSTVILLSIRHRTSLGFIEDFAFGGVG